MKRIILGLVLLFISFIFIACNEKNELKKIELDTSAIGDGIKKEDFHFDLVKIKLIYDNEEKTIPLSKDYIDIVTEDEFLKYPNHYIKLAFDKSQNLGSYSLTKQ